MIFYSKSGFSGLLTSSSCCVSSWLNTEFSKSLMSVNASHWKWLSVSYRTAACRSHLWPGAVSKRDHCGCWMVKEVGILTSCCVLWGHEFENAGNAVSEEKNVRLSQEFLQFLQILCRTSIVHVHKLISMHLSVSYKIREVQMLRCTDVPTCWLRSPELLSLHFSARYIAHVHY